MKTKFQSFIKPVIVLWISCALSVAIAQSETYDEKAKQILDATNVEGGLIVHIGCSEGKLTAKLRANDSYLVHGLGTEAKNVEKAREYIKSLGIYGPVSIEHLNGKRLPYVDNLVNFVVAEDLSDVPMDEVMRVLCPNGVAYVKEGGKWNRTVKPTPEEIDDWTHFLYDSSNNAVSKDSVVGPPRQLQWVAGPEWARSHDHLASVSVLVSSGGRIFYIVDEGPIAAVVLKPRWYLVARDSFSGVVLWKRAVLKWQWHLRGFRSGPSDLSRRMVAVGERVYVTLDLEGPLIALDAATGHTIRTYEQTQGALEVVYYQGTLFVVIGKAPKLQSMAGDREQQPGFAQVRPQRPPYIERQPTKKIIAIHAQSGRVLWTKSNADTEELMPTT